MGNDTSKFQIRVRNGPSRVRERDQLLLDGQRERLAPKDRSVPSCGGYRVRGGGGGY
jgi:hypothetical protein